MSGFVLAAETEMDLNDIWDYIAADSPDAADRWMEKLFATFEALARNPGIGHKREALTPHPVLFFPVGSYLIIYRHRPEDCPVEIVAVTQGARDIPAFLRTR